MAGQSAIPEAEPVGSYAVTRLSTPGGAWVHRAAGCGTPNCPPPDRSPTLRPRCRPQTAPERRGDGGPHTGLGPHADPALTEQLGISPGRRRLDRRIAATRALPEETDLPVETIARSVGLSSRPRTTRRGAAPGSARRPETLRPPPTGASSARTRPA